MANEINKNPQALAQQVMAAANSLSDEEAAQRYQQILAQLPPDQASELNTLALSQVASDERRSLARNFKQAHNDPNSAFDSYDTDDDDEAASPTNLGRMSVRAQQQDPSLLGGIFGNNSALGGQLGKAALAALAALLIQRMMNNQNQGRQSSNADPIGSILGGLLGGGSGGYGGGYGTQSPSGGLGDILGGLLGGGGYGNQPMPQRGQSSGGGLGDILGGLLGGGASTQHIPQGGGGLGDILGSILGGGSPTPAQPRRPAQPRSTPANPGAGSHRKRIHLGDDDQ